MGRTAKIYKFQRQNGAETILTVKPNAVNLFSQPENDLWTFDLEGRLLGMFVDGINYRRTLSNHYYRKDRISIEGEDYRNVSPFDQEFAAELLHKAHKKLKFIKYELSGETLRLIDKILIMDADSLEKDGQIFDDIYLPVSILPPDQYLALVIQITEGCNYNRCTFCNFYRDRPFKIKKITEIEDHLDRIIGFLGAGIHLRKSIFLADANALVTPQKRLIEALETIRSKTGAARKIYSFIDVFTGIRKTSEDFLNLAELGLQRVYLGVESGDPQLLELLHKPQMTDDIIGLAENLKSGGIRLGVIFLTGAGGWEFHAQHLRESEALLNKLPLGKGDIIYLSEFYETNPEYDDELRKEGILQPHRQDIRKMTLEFQSKMRKFASLGVKVSPYDIQQFLY